MLIMSDYTKEERMKMANYLVDHVLPIYKDSIEDSINHTTIFDGTVGKEKLEPRFDHMPIFIVNDTSTGCVFHDNLDRQGKTLVLNFASYKNPGGMFLNGSSAQEEALCHQSTLYPVLCAFQDTWYANHIKHLNNGLYGDDLLISPITFLDIDPYDMKPGSDSDAPEYGYIINDDAYVAVITCAAPNAGAYLRREYGLAAKDEFGRYPTEPTLNQAVLKRAESILYAAAKVETDILVLGAFGCGVFKNNPRTVADAFFGLLATKYRNVFHQVYFPIPDKNSYISHDFINSAMKYDELMVAIKEI